MSLLNRLKEMNWSKKDKEEENSDLKPLVMRRRPAPDVKKISIHDRQGVKRGARPA